MKIEDVKYTIEHMKTFNSHHDYLILHCGGNNIGHNMKIFNSHPD